jgi:hypothetical protein
MAWNTAICQVCCNPPQVALNASQVLENNRNLTQYIYTSTIQAQRPNKPYQYKSQTERLQTLMGRISNPQAVALRSNGGVGCQCTSLPAVTGINSEVVWGDPSVFTVTWNAVPGATSYVVTTDFPNPSEIIITGTSATFTSDQYGTDYTITVTASSSCSTVTATAEFTNGPPCFLAGSLVTLADGSEKPIEDIQIGDVLLGAFGEHNTVLALHRPLLGNNAMCKINGEHSTTNHHPHISVDKKFYSGDPIKVTDHTYGREHDVIVEGGATEKWLLHGLKPGRVELLHTGVNLKTVEGSRVVESLEVYSLPPETQLYNLVMGGSHTYHVDGYAVTGWPREDDFDYDLWVPRS